MMSVAEQSWYQRIPKVELHVHLEGAIPTEALWELIEKYGGDPSTPDREALERRFIYRDFSHFIENWVWKNRFLREYEDFTFIAEHVARDLASQNIRYAEVFYSPPDFARFGLQPQKLTEAIRAGLKRVPEIEIALVADLVRDFGPKSAARTLQAVNEVKSLGVIGIGIGGSEHAFPPEPFAAVFETARRLGFHTSAHAGEAAGAASIWGALRSLKAERIGHGTRAFEDAALLDYLVQRRIPVEMCPLSNLRTGVVNAIQEHPVKRYFEQGMIVTINTDDPKLFGNSLATEYHALQEELDFTRADIRQLTHFALQSSWLPDERKLQLSDEVFDDPAWLEVAL